MIDVLRQSNGDDRKSLPQRLEQVVRSLVDEVHQRNLVGIMVTHDLAMAAHADRSLEIRDGELQS